MHAMVRLCVGLIAAACAASAAGAEIGKVILATGATSALRGASTVALARGAAIEEKDVLQTGPNSFLQVRFDDASIMALKEQSRLGVEEYRYAGKPDGQERAAFRLLKGAVRTITGTIGQERYEMRTSVSTVGIRGTMYALGVCEGDCVNADGTTAPDGAYGSVLGPSFGTNKLVSNNKAGESVIEQGQNFHIASINSLPALLLEQPSFLSARLPGKPAAVAAGTGAAGGASSDSRANTLPGAPNQIAATTATPQLVGGPQNLGAGGMPIGVHTASMMGQAGFVPGGGGAGIVRGQLAWTTTADMDLHLNLPTGQVVSCGAICAGGSRNVTFNGGTANAMLDRDNTTGTTNPANPAVENITVTGNVPPGNYTFFVRNFGGVPTASVLRVTGDNNATGRTHNVPTLTGGQQSPNFVVTRQPNGTATYNP